MTVVYKKTRALVSKQGINTQHEHVFGGTGEHDHLFQWTKDIFWGLRDIFTFSKDQFNQGFNQGLIACKISGNVIN